MNENGLVVELMWLDGTQYPMADDRVGLSELQWIQYQLDNAATVDEVIASDLKVRINAENSVPLHFLIADASGNAATIEFLKGRMVVHTDKKLPFAVLTNTAYSDALQLNASSQSKSFTDNSLQRFATACQLVQNFGEIKEKTNPVNYSFHILEKVAQNGFTRWRIVYDINDKKIHFISDKNIKRRTVAFSAFDFNCKNKISALNINGNTSGNVSSFFKPLTYNINKSVIQTSAVETKAFFEIPAAAVNSMADFFYDAKCKVK